MSDEIEYEQMMNKMFPPPPPAPKENRHQYFVRRLKELGMYDIDSDYDGAIGIVVEKMSEAFSSYGHSGGSAEITMGVFNQLMDEWTHGPIKE